MGNSFQNPPASRTVIFRHALLRAPLHAALLAAGILLGSPAHAVLADLRLQVDHDGTALFDPTDGPGLDSGAHNGIVRTHDEFQYSLGWSSNSGETGMRIQLTMPRGSNGEIITAWKAIPPQCVAAESSLSADGQVLNCRVSDYSSSGTAGLNFVGSVLGSARNGQRIPAPDVRIRSDSTPESTPDATSASLTVSAAPFYDVRLTLLSNENDASQYREGSGPNGEDGFFHRIHLALFAHHPNGHGIKGVEQLRPNEPVLIDLDTSRFPASVRVNDWQGQSATGSFGDGCGSNGPRATAGAPSDLAGGTITLGGQPNDLGPSRSTASNTLANGGDCRVASSTRERVQIALEGVDTSLQHMPTHMANGTALPPGQYWVANKTLLLWTDRNDYPVGTRVNHGITLAGIQAQSLSNQTAVDQVGNNHAVSYQKLFSPSGSTSKYYRPDATLPLPWRTYYDQTGSITGPTNQMAIGQTVGGQITVQNTGPVPLSNVMLCDVIDRTAFDIADHFRIDAATSPGMTISYGARRGSSRHFASTDTATDEFVLRTTPGQLAVGTSEYATARCDSPDIVWFDNHRDAENAGGLVYVRGTIRSLAGNSTALLRFMGLKLRETWGETIQVLSPTPATRVKGERIPENTILRNKSDVSTPTLPSLQTGQGRWDHLRVIGTRNMTRITKQVTDPANTATTPVRSGSVVSYRLEPRIATVFPPLATDVTVRDVLPEGMSYVAGSATLKNPTTNTTTAQEPRILRDTPDTGLTTLEWTFDDHLPHGGLPTDAGARMPIIDFRARVSRSLPDGTQLRNQALISGGAHDQEADCSYNTGTKGYADNCPKGAVATISVSSPPGFFVEKSTSTPTIEPGEPFDYTVSFLSMGNELMPPNIPDIIDILPFPGDGNANPALGFHARSPASSFRPGAYRLVSVTPPAIDPGAIVHFTRRPHREIHNNPADASNQIPGGATRWCRAAEFGAAGCPANIGESTAVRVTPGLSSLQAGVSYAVQMNLESDPVVAQAGNVFANVAGFAATNPASTLQYVQSQADLNVRVSQATGSIGGRIFMDADQNNQFDGADTAIGGQCVSLSGTNARGQRITLSMRSDAAGNYLFRDGAAGTVYNSADCSGQALPHFGGLPKGEYTLTRIDAPSPDLLEGAIHAGTAGGTVGNRQIAGITLDTGVHATGYHFTDAPGLSSLSGRIFLDVNQNNTIDDGDNGLSGQCVSTTGTDVRGQQVTLSMRTDADGNYSFREGAAGTVFASANCTGNAQARFGGLLQGTYALNRVDATPVEHLDGAIHAGSAQGTVGNRQITQIALAANTHATGYHFTDTPALSSLAGRIFTDANQNNLFEVGDAGVAGQCVSIQGTNLRNQAVTLSMRTDDDGRYAFVAGAPGTVFESANCTGTALPQFGGLPGGTYAVSRVDPVPAGHRSGRLYAGSVQGMVGTGQITQIVLPANTQAIDYNFTDFPLMSSLSGRIFTDRNQDGNFEAGDAGVANQCVSLTGTNLTGQQVTLSMRTDAQGHYGFKEGSTDSVFESADCSGTALPSFGGLFSGEYAVSRVSNVPAGQQEGKIHAGPVGGTVGTRQITGIRIANNMEAIDYNFTDVLQIGSVSGRILADLDQDGQIDTGDVGVGGQCVALRGTNVKGETIELSMRTSADGNYAFREGAADTVFASADCSGTAMPAFDGLYQGTYAISRVDQPLAGHLDGKIYPGTPAGTVGTREITQIALGASVNGTGYDFTDIPQRPRLTLRRTVNNDDGGTATLEDVTLSADSSSTLTGEQMNIAGTPLAAGGITQREMPAGVFALHHDHVAGYETGSWSCVVNGAPATLSGQQFNTLTLNWGDVADCQVVYDDQRARLTLQKELDLSGRGGARANREDFTLEATRLNDAGQPGTAADDRISGVMGEADVTAKPVKAGQYLLSENLTQQQARDFNAAAWACSVQQAGQTTTGNRTTTTSNIIALSPGDQAICSVLNTNKAASFSYRNVTDVSNASNASGGSNPSSATGGGTGTSSGSSGTGTGGTTGSQVRPPMPIPVIYFGRAGRPETRIDLSKVGDKAEDEIELVQGDQYEFSVALVKGYETPKLLCRDGDGEEIRSPFTLDGQIISCDVVLVRKDTRVQLSKTVVEGYPRPVDGSVTDFDIDYLISVTHDGDSDRGKYDLFDMPDFDSRAMEAVELQRVILVDEKGTETDELKPVLERGRGTDGWALAREHDIDFGATHTYRVSFRVRVREDFDDTRGACTGPGTGLYNRAVLDARNDLTDPTGSGQKARLPQSDAHAACPAVPKIATSSRITIEKRSSTRSAEVGDLLTYRLVIRNRDKGIARAPVVIDRLPAGFRLEPGSVRMQKGSDPAVSVVPASRVKVVGNREVQIQLADIPGEKHVSGSASPESMVTITYRVRLGVGSQEGDGINRAHVECPTNAARTARAQCSNEARWQVKVTDGVFSEEACVAGQVYVDCNGNSVKDREELGIPGVRLYLQNGTWMVSDEQGKYSHCGLRPRTHVLKVDSRTLPRRARLVTSSAQNVGDAHSLFVDARKGMLHRVDFIEGSCSNTVIEQVKARQQQGANVSAQTETGQPALTFDSKKAANARPRQQGTDPAQPAARTRH